ncbi:MAG: hypothetical protein Phog2KO_49160 [Phototrophicaceae bacterium]
MEQTHIFKTIEKGMPVLQESDKEKIGTVEYVKFGEGEGTVDLPQIDNIVKALAEAVDATRNYPDEVYQRLYTEGFLIVDRGLNSDVYVLSSQVVHVVDGEVHVNVDADDLLKK